MLFHRLIFPAVLFGLIASFFWSPGRPELLNKVVTHKSATQGTMLEKQMPGNINF